MIIFTGLLRNDYLLHTVRSRSIQTILTTTLWPWSHCPQPFAGPTILADNHFTREIIPQGMLPCCECLSSQGSSGSSSPWTWCSLLSSLFPTTLRSSLYTFISFTPDKHTVSCSSRYCSISAFASLPLQSVPNSAGPPTSNRGPLPLGILCCICTITLGFLNPWSINVTCPLFKTAFQISGVFEMLEYLYTVRVLSVAMVKHPDPKQLGKEKAYLTYASRSQSIVEGRQAGNQERTWGKTQGAMLLAGSLTAPCWASFLSAAQDYLPRKWYCPLWALPHEVRQAKSPSQTCSWVILIKTVTQLRLFSWGILESVRLTT